MDNIQKLTFNVYHSFTLPKDDAVIQITADSLSRVLTMNENIKQYGFTLRPNDIFILASSQAFQEGKLYIDSWMKEILPDIKAKPMYPDFPRQVLEIDDVVLKLHQICHYFSFTVNQLTPGLENAKAWLPPVEETEKVKKDVTLLKAKPLSIISYKDFMQRVFTLIEKRERWTVHEAYLVLEVFNRGELTADNYALGFKENLHFLAYNYAVFHPDKTVLKQILLKFTQNPNDVLDCVEVCVRPNSAGIYTQSRQWDDYDRWLSHMEYRELIRKDTHKNLLKTSIKRVFVSILEGFSVKSFEENLVDNNNEERNKMLMKSLSYSRFSRSIDHLKAVEKLRNKQLQSWEGKVEERIKTLVKAPKTSSIELIKVFAERPGVMVRNVVRLMRLGVTYEDFEQALNENIITNDMVKSISFQTLISNLNYFSQDFENYQHLFEEECNSKQIDIVELDCGQRLKEIEGAYKVFELLLKTKLNLITTPLKDKKVFVNERMYDFAHSMIETNSKSSVGTYLRSGIAVAIPEEVNYLRFFTYWNDKYNIDIDLHGKFYDVHGEVDYINYMTSYKNNYGLTFSGDIRHSDAAEYIDIDLKKANDTGVLDVECDINLFSGANFFKDIETCFVGMLAVQNNEKDVKLYNSQNVFFRHDLVDKSNFKKYAFINIPNRYLRIQGAKRYVDSSFTLNRYLELLFIAQNAQKVENQDEADIILTLDQADDEEKGISILDNDFFISEEFLKK